MELAIVLSFGEEKFDYWLPGLGIIKGLGQGCSVDRGLRTDPDLTIPASQM